MQLSSSPTSGLLDATSYIFCFMILLFSTIASAQPSMQPNDLGFLYCSVVKGSAGETIDISVIFSVNRQFQLDCSIKFPSEESPPQEYKFCEYKERDFYLFIAIREYEALDDFKIYVKEQPYEIRYGNEYRFGSPVWRLNMTGRHTREFVDWAQYYARMYTSQIPPFELADIEEQPRRDENN